MKNRITLFLCMLGLSSFSQINQTSGKPTRLPSVLINGRFYIKIVTVNRDTLLAFCDTGGGYNAIYPSSISQLHLENKVMEITIDGEKTKYLPAVELINDPNIPLPHIPQYYQNYIKTPFFEAPEDSKEDAFFASYIPRDVFLGQFFFIDHAWTFNYPKKSLYINTPLASGPNPNMQAIGFKKNRDGTKRFGHPSMKIEVDGQVIDVLFDTGASILLSKSTQEALSSASKSIGGSFIAKSIFDEWHAKHPDWRYIEKGEVTGADMIEVPVVKVGNLSAGPVWFAKRPDQVWSSGMIGSMDKVVKGALGGSFLQYFVVTIDYNNELISFSKE